MGLFDPKSPFFSYGAESVGGVLNAVKKVASAPFDIDGEMWQVDEWGQTVPYAPPSVLPAGPYNAPDPMAGYEDHDAPELPPMQGPDMTDKLAGLPSWAQEAYLMGESGSTIGQRILQPAYDIANTSIAPLKDAKDIVVNQMQRSDELRGGVGFGGTPGLTEAAQATIPTTVGGVALELSPLGTVGDVRSLGNRAIRAGMPETPFGAANYGAGVPPPDDLAGQVGRAADEIIPAPAPVTPPAGTAAPTSPQAPAGAPASTGVPSPVGQAARVRNTAGAGQATPPATGSPSMGAATAPPPRSPASAAGAGAPPDVPPAPPTGGGGAVPPDPARALDGVIPGETVPDAAFRQYEGAIETTARIERANLDDGARKLKFFNTAAADTPDMRGLYSALHGEGTVPPKLQAIYDDAKRLLSEEEALTLDFDPQFQLHPDYFPRFWKAPKTTGATPKALGAKPAFVKPRANATFNELLAAGYEPRTWDPYEMVALRRMAGAEYREQSKLLGILKGEGLTTDVVGPIPDGWRIPDVGGAVFQPKPYLDAAGEIRYTPPKMVPNGVANVLEQMFGRKLNWGTVGNVDVHNAVSAVFNAPKRVKLMGSFFQQMDFANRTGFASIGGAINDALHGKPLSAITKVARLPVSVGELVAANVSPARRQMLRRAMTSNVPVIKERPGLTWNLISKQGLSGGDVTAFNKTMRDTLIQSVSDNSLKGRPRRIANAINGAMERGLFEGVYPQAQKTAIENFIAPALTRSHPDWTDAQLAASIATEANKMFSSLPRSQSAMRHMNRNLTEVSRMLIFSTNETESFLKATASAFHGPNKEMWASYWGGGVLFLAGLAEAVHFITTGEPLPMERLNPTTEGGPLGRTYNPRFLSPDIPLKGRGGTNLQLDLLMQMDTSLRLLDPKSFVQARENVIPRAVTNQVSGKDFFGKPLDSAKERIGQFASDVGMPIPVQQASSLLVKRFPALEGWISEQEARLGTEGQLAQVSGINLRADTNSMVRDNLARNSGMVDKGGRPLESWNQATPAQQQELLQRPENQGLVKELEQRLGELAETGDVYARNSLINQQERQEQERVATEYIDTRLAAGELTGYEARKAYDEAVKELSIARQAREKLLPERKETTATTEADRAERDYYAIFDKEGIENADGTLNYRAYDKALQEWQAKYPDYSKSDVSPAKPLSPGHAELIAGREEARPYFELQDKAFEKAKKEQPELYGDFESVEDFKAAEKAIWLKQGMTPEQADRIAQTMIDATLVDAKIDSIFYLFENPAQAAFLVKYGYYVPSAIKKVVELEQVAQPAGAR